VPETKAAVVRAWTKASLDEKPTDRDYASWDAVLWSLMCRRGEHNKRYYTRQ
jgi:hypothetical protein